MTIRHMIIFRTVCENGYNSTKAAEVLHMTQPAVSLAIKELEQYYGVHLFDRIGRRLQITDAGQHFLQYAIHISDLFSDMETGLRDWDSKGVLRIGASITIGSQFLPNYVKAFSELCPGLDVRVTVEQSERLEQKILANELDCALIEGIAHDPNIVSEAYMEDHLSVICGTDNGWTQGQVISIEDFQRQRFLLREKGSGTREVFNRVVEQAGIHITPVRLHEHLPGGDAVGLRLVGFDSFDFCRFPAPGVVDYKLRIDAQGGIQDGFVFDTLPCNIPHGETVEIGKAL